MATTQKKKTSSTKKTKSSPQKSGKSSSGTGSRQASSSARRGSSSAAKTVKAAEARRPIRREAGGLGLLLLALCVFISLFNEDGWLIALLPMVLKGCFGWGYYLAVPALCIAGWILCNHRGKPVTLRVTSVLLLPALFGLLAHLLFCHESFEETKPLITALWNAGQELACGGILSGTLAIGCTALLGVGASVVIVLILIVVLLMVTFELTVEKIVQLWRDRLDYYEEDYEDDADFFEAIREVPAERRKKESPPPAKSPVKDTAKRSAGSVKGKNKPSEIDIPLDGPFLSEDSHTGGFFRPRDKDQLTPADLFKTEELVEDEPLSAVIMEEKHIPTTMEKTVPFAKTKTEPVPKPIATLISEAIAASVSVPAPPPISAPIETVMVSEPVPEPIPEPVRHPAPEPIPAPVPEPIPLTPPPPPPVERTDPPIATISETVASAVEETALSRKQAAAEVEQASAEVAAEIERGRGVEGEYAFPSVELLHQNTQDNYIEAGAELRTNAQRLADTLRSFGVVATAGDVVRGPAITRYEFVLEQGVKLSKITNLADDIALALGASGVRIAPIPDKISVVGIEVPNKTVSQVLIRDVIASQTFAHHKSPVAFSVGRDISNQDVVGDIAKLPHVLIAGTTGSGKSVCTNSLIISLLYKSSPEDVRFIMVDPKMVELAPYNGIPHLLIPVVTDPKKAAGALQWAVYEMMKRYKTFSELGVKKLEEYNAVAAKRDDLPHMASVVVVIDELADLMLVAAKEVEESICRVAQMGRAAGMHLVIATQRPSADVITGLMKANIPSRIAFAVASSLESRIILDATGAEKLVGRGDMLYAPLGCGKPQRVQGCFITPEEIDRVVSFVKSTGEAQYSDEIMQKIEESVKEKDKKGGAGGGNSASAVSTSEGDDCDELLPAAVEVILETGQASVSMLQRRLKLGYSRAARLVDQMEERGIVGPFEGSKPRQLLISKERWQEMQMGNAPNSVTADEAAGSKKMNWDDGEHVIPWEEQE